MVVSEEDNPKNTTTVETKEGIIDSLTLNYDLPSNDIESKILDESKEEREIILTETEIIDEFLEEEKDNKNSIGKEIKIPFEDRIETGLEILYTSMKLKKFPIKENNLPLYDEIIENISLNGSSLHIGNTLLSNVNIRILGYKKFKLIEFKTREFKLALSVALFNGNTIKKYDDYFSYEIFSRLKNSRIQAVAEIFKRIFSGELITFQIKDLYGDIQFENPIQTRKFDIIIESIKKYEEVMKLLNISKVKNFSESSLQFYTLHLLHSYLNNNLTLNSWINFRIDNRFDINSGDKISFIKIHNLNIRGFNYDLKEIASIKAPLSEKEVNFEKNIVLGYRKIVDIRLELIEKQF